MHKTGIEFDFDLAQRQHREMVQIYQDAGVTCHFLESDPVLHRNFFARDSSVMTPRGALICHMQLKCRRADYLTVIKFYQEINIPIWRYAIAGHFVGGDFVDVEFSEAKDLGVNLLSLGNKKVLSMAGSVKLNKDLIARGHEVFAPDMSMFTLGGGGVHCLCQALKRDSVCAVGLIWLCE
ncbi:MAG: hypothetical protein GY896_04705 [Gammaproteobacteria bacterium]|nr:hypothetical protein [Gammaproteobacteria bacterium]